MRKYFCLFNLQSVLIKVFNIALDVNRFVAEVKKVLPFYDDLNNARKAALVDMEF